MHRDCNPKSSADQDIAISRRWVGSLNNLINLNSNFIPAFVFEKSEVKVTLFRNQFYTESGNLILLLNLHYIGLGLCVGLGFMGQG